MGLGTPQQFIPFPCPRLHQPLFRRWLSWGGLREGQPHSCNPNLPCSAAFLPVSHPFPPVTSTPSGIPELGAVPWAGAAPSCLFLPCTTFIPTPALCPQLPSLWKLHSFPPHPLGCSSRCSQHRQFPGAPGCCCSPHIHLLPPPAQNAGHAAAQGERHPHPGDLLPVPHPPLPLHVRGLRPPGGDPGVPGAVPNPPALQHRQRLPHRPPALLVQAHLPQGRPPLRQLSRPPQQITELIAARGWHRAAPGPSMGSSDSAGLLELEAASRLQRRARQHQPGLGRLSSHAAAVPRVLPPGWEPAWKHDIPSGIQPCGPADLRVTREGFVPAPPARLPGLTPDTGTARRAGACAGMLEQPGWGACAGPAAAPARPGAAAQLCRAVPDLY